MEKAERVEKVERAKPTISSSTIKMEDYKGKIERTIFDNCTFENFDDIKIINCNIHNCIFNDPKDYLKAMNNNKLTKCRTDFTTLLTMVIRSSSMDMLEEVQKVMDQDENYKDQVLMTFKKG